MGLLDRTLMLGCPTCGHVTMKRWGWLKDHPHSFDCANGHTVVLDYGGSSEVGQAMRAVDQRERELREAFERIVRAAG